MTDAQKAEVVTYSWHKLMRIKRGFSSASVPTKGVALQNCIRFFDASVEISVGCLSMMIIGYERYSSAWLKRVFGTPHPPFNLVISEKVLIWIRTQLPVTVYSGNQNKMADAIIGALNQEGVDTTTAYDLVKAGFMTGNNHELKQEILRRMEAEWAK